MWVNRCHTILVDMEDILPVIFDSQPDNSLFHRFLRKDYAQSSNNVGLASKTLSSSWKAVLWDRQSVEPAMLR
jgi:hypothetical protein